MSTTPQGRAGQARINGWQIYMHPLFRAQLEHLREQVAALKRKHPLDYSRRNATKRLAAITRLAFEIIPQDPARPECRQGGTLGEKYKHWFRARFFQQYRLFFRYHATSRVIVYAWVNDEEAKRSYDNNDDAYRVFRKMLEGGNPSDNWDELMMAAREQT